MVYGYLNKPNNDSTLFPSSYAPELLYTGSDLTVTEFTMTKRGYLELVGGTNAYAAETFIRIVDVVNNAVLFAGRSSNRNYQYMISPWIPVKKNQKLTCQVTFDNKSAQFGNTGFATLYRWNF